MGKTSVSIVPDRFDGNSALDEGKFGFKHTYHKLNDIRTPDRTPPTRRHMKYVRHNYKIFETQNFGQNPITVLVTRDEKNPYGQQNIKITYEDYAS